MHIPTPWGISQTEDKIGHGILFVSTSSHGGYFIPPDINWMIPEYARRRSGWYEEDCEWCIPFCFLPATFFSQDAHTAKLHAGSEPKSTLKNWYPDIYEQFYHETIPDGESLVKDERLFSIRHKDHWCVISAWGSWHKDVPEGMVGVGCTLGGSRKPGTPERYFLVPQEAHQRRNMVITDPSMYQEVQRFS